MLSRRMLTPIIEENMPVAKAAGAMKTPVRVEGAEVGGGGRRVDVSDDYDDYDGGRVKNEAAAT